MFSQQVFVIEMLINVVREGVRKKPSYFSPLVLLA